VGVCAPTITEFDSWHAIEPDFDSGSDGPHRHVIPIVFAERLLDDVPIGYGQQPIRVSLNRITARDGTEFVQQAAP
jgi:hypothetical protein